MEQRVVMNNTSVDILDVKQGRVSINDIKYDLIKIIEPYDGVLENNENAGNKVRRLFASYLGDLKTCGLISDYTILSTNRESAITYDVAVQLSADRSAKKLKIHVGVFQEPWVSKK